MSRIGKSPISIPEKVDIKLANGLCTVQGPKGTLSWNTPAEIDVKIDSGQIVCSPTRSDKATSAKFGLTRALINNMVVGVTYGFKKEMQLVGVGYRASVQGSHLVLSVGYSKPVEMEIPQELSVEINKKQDEMIVTGIDKQVLGEWCAVVRRVRPPEPYKGKGIRYKDEIVRTKQGKRVGA